MRVGRFDLRGNSQFAKRVDKAFKALSSGLDGDELDKFTKEYEDAIDVFGDKEAMDVGYEMETYEMYHKDKDAISSIDDEIEEIQKKIDELKNPKSEKYKSKTFMKNLLKYNKKFIDKYEKDIETLQDKKKRFGKWKDKLTNAKITFIKINQMYNKYLNEYPEEDDD